MNWISRFQICAFLLIAQTQAVELNTVVVATGLNQPVFVTAPPGDFDRLFIVQRGGRILILNLATGTVNATPFLDIASLITTFNHEQGLLGLAFDPNYASNGKFYVCYTAVSTWAFRVTQFQVSSDPNVAEAGSADSILVFSHPGPTHNGGWIGFSPRAADGNNLYIASGDGGLADDQGFGHIEPGGNAQNNTTLLGKILRIQINSSAGTYSIPANNPFAGSQSLKQEIWANGLRNPYRCSFDRLTGNFFIGDVGQGNREEVDVQKPDNPGGGENYGWRLREGMIPTPSGSPPVGGPKPPGAIDPLVEYPHTVGRAVIGGYIYRGEQIPELRGAYLFGDYTGPPGVGDFGKIFSLNYDGAIATNFQEITAQLFPSVDGFSLLQPSSFGEDANGELYVTDIGGGRVFKIIPAVPHVGVESITKEEGEPVVLQCYGVPFQIYSVQATNSLVEEFETIGSEAAGGDGAFDFEDAAGATQRFYRVISP